MFSCLGVLGSPPWVFLCPYSSVLVHHLFLWCFSSPCSSTVFQRDPSRLRGRSHHRSCTTACGVARWVRFRRLSLQPAFRTCSYRDRTAPPRFPTCPVQLVVMSLFPSPWLRYTGVIVVIVVVTVAAFVSVLALGVSSFSCLFAFAITFAPFVPAVSASVTRLPAVSACSVAFPILLRLACGLQSSFGALFNVSYGSTFLVMVAALLVVVIFLQLYSYSSLSAHDFPFRCS